MDIAQALVAILIYPGMLLALVGGMLYTVLSEGRAALRLPLWGGWRGAEGLLAAASVVLTGCGLALLPWPWHPLGAGTPRWVWSWAALEGAFLLPLLPALGSGWPPLVRTAIREAQSGVAGRTLLWGAMAAGLVRHGDWSTAMLAPHLLALAAGALALPAALSWGWFAAETALTAGGVESGLPAAQTMASHFARDTRLAALLAAALVALLPVGASQPWIGAFWLVGGFGVAGAALGRWRGTVPRLALPDALRRCWLWSAPLSAAAVAALALV